MKSEKAVREGCYFPDKIRHILSDSSTCEQTRFRGLCRRGPAAAPQKYGREKTKT